MRTLCTAALLVFLLNACGLKGPLYHPQNTSSPQPSQSQDGEKKK